MHYTITENQDASERHIVPKRRALIVSNDPAFLISYRGVFAGIGLPALVRDSYEAGLTSLDRKTFDFILVDQGNAAFEGRCILERVASVHRSARVLVVARCHDTVSFLQAMRLGALDYLEEPVSVPDLVRVITGSLAEAPRSS